MESKVNIRSYNYYTCGKTHEERKSDRKPNQPRTHAGCEILNDGKEIARRTLQVAFGMAFGESGMSLLIIPSSPLTIGLLGDVVTPSIVVLRDRLLNPCSENWG